jgi:hypothetical protein
MAETGRCRVLFKFVRFLMCTDNNSDISLSGKSFKPEI